MLIYNIRILKFIFRTILHLEKNTKQNYTSQVASCCKTGRI